MTRRQLPDGSWLDTMTGDLSGFDPAREAIGKTLAIRAGQRRPDQGLAGGGGNPTPPTPPQKMVVLPGIRGPQAIIDPKSNLLSPNPFELGMGLFTPESKKKLMVLGVFVGGCAAWVWWQKRQAGKKANPAADKDE